LATLSDAVGNGWKTVANIPVKQFDMQADMKTHLSQSTGAGAFDGQHGIFAISSIVADVDISSAIACIEAWKVPRHDGPGNRSQRKASDRHDREQPAYGEVALHGA